VKSRRPFGRACRMGLLYGRERCHRKQADSPAICRPRPCGTRGDRWACLPTNAHCDSGMAHQIDHGRIKGNGVDGRRRRECQTASRFLKFGSRIVNLEITESTLKWPPLKGAPRGVVTWTIPVARHRHMPFRSHRMAGHVAGDICSHPSCQIQCRHRKLGHRRYR
jgi:hypothetical protein